MMEISPFTSPFGAGWVALQDGAVIELHLDGRPPRGVRLTRLPIARKIERYFRGEAVRFDEPIAVPPLSRFARRVYEAVRAIPRGQVRTYGEIAAKAGSRGAARAVGQLMKRNPLCLIIP